MIPFMLPFAVLFVTLLSGPTQASTCFGDWAATQKAIEEILDIKDCESSASIGECQDRLYLGSILAAAGGAAALRANFNTQALKHCRAPQSARTPLPWPLEMLRSKEAQAQSARACQMNTQLAKRAIVDSARQMVQEQEALHRREVELMNSQRQIALEQIEVQRRRELLLALERDLSRNPERFVLPSQSRRGNPDELIAERQRVIREILDEAERQPNPQAQNDYLKRQQERLMRGYPAQADVVQRLQATFRPDMSDVQRALREMDQLDQVGPYPANTQVMDLSREHPSLRPYAEQRYRVTSSEAALSQARRNLLNFETTPMNSPQELSQGVQRHFPHLNQPSGLRAPAFSAHPHLIHHLTPGGPGQRQQGHRLGGRTAATVIGGKALALASSGPLMAAEMLVTPTTMGCSDLPGGPYAAHGPDCQVLAEIAPQTLAFLSAASPEEIARELKLREPFCQALKSYHQQGSADRWQIECTHTGFTLKEKGGGRPKSYVVDAEEGEIRRVRLLTSGTPKARVETNFSFLLNPSGELSEVRGLKGWRSAAQPGALEFENSRTYNSLTRPEDKSWEETLTQSWGSSATQGYLDLRRNQMALAQAQACCGGSEGLSHLCQPHSSSPTGSPSGPSPQRSKAIQ